MGITKTAVIYQAFEKEEIYEQCVFSIFSFCASNIFSDKTIFLVTDNKQFFEHNLPDVCAVEFVEVSESDLVRMRGKIDFIHRIKIASIELVANQKQRFERYLYIDCDTIVKQDFSIILSKISEDTSLFHTHEFKFEDCRTLHNSNLTKQLYNSLVDDKIKFVKKDKAIKVQADFSSWNAGVIGIHKANLHLLKYVYALTDALYDNVRHHGAEQFAFSYVLEKETSIITCQDIVHHYWLRPKKAIAQRFIGKILKGNTPFQILEFSGNIDRLEYLFRHHFLHFQTIAIQSFIQDQYLKGIVYSIKRIIRKPFAMPVFYVDLLYYTKIKIIRELLKWRLK